MTEREREARRLRLLLARIQRDRKTAYVVYDRVRLASDRVRETVVDAVTVGAMALYLQNLYTTLEELLRRVAAELDGWIPGGDDWHRELLGQMTLEIEGVRAGLLDDPLHRDLDLLRRFRHVVRHAYAADYDWEEMQEALAAADRVMASLPDALEGLDQTIRAAMAECEREDPR